MIKIIKWKDNDDGSADVTFEMSEEEKETFAEIGIRQCIKEGIKATEGEIKDEHGSDGS